MRGAVTEAQVLQECKAVPGLMKQSDADDLNAILHGRLNQFVRCCGIRAELGKPLELTPDLLVGLRGWAHVTVRKYNKTASDGGKGEERQTNQVSWWITDKGVLPPNRPDETNEPQW